MPSLNEASLRHKVEQIARAPLAKIDSVIRSLDPAHDTPGAAQARQIESALAKMVGEPEEAPLSSDLRDAAARRIQRAWRRSRKRSRSRALIGELLAHLVTLEIVGLGGGGKRLIASLAKERDGHVNAMGTMLTVLSEHGRSTTANDLIAMIESVIDLDHRARKKLFPKMTVAQAEALHRGLVYLSNSARASYQIDFKGGLLMWRGAPFDTSDMISHWSPEGRAIYVMDKQGRFYAAEQRLPDDRYDETRFHHSSFLSGAPVFGAGEMQVAAGKLDVLTAQSGHYHPTHKEMQQTVRRLAENGIRFYRIALWAKDKPTAMALRQKFSKAQTGLAGSAPDPNEPPATYRASTERSADDMTSQPSRIDGKELAVYVPAQEYLFNSSLHSLWLYDPTNSDMTQ